MHSNMQKNKTVIAENKKIYPAIYETIILKQDAPCDFTERHFTSAAI